MWDTLADLGGVASFTSLESLRITVRNWNLEPGPVVVSLSLLTVLTQLTLLDLREDLDFATWTGRSFPSDVSVLSSLSALRVLRCHFLEEAMILAGDPLPVQVRFLHAVTGLEELKLGFRESFWSLPHASCLAMQGAVAALQSLKKVVITILDPGFQQLHLPLSVFAAAPSTETFVFKVVKEFPAPAVWIPGYSSAQARECFKALAKLRCLELRGCTVYGHIPRAADLLAGLPSTCLTRLALQIAFEPIQVELMEQVARFRDLEELDVRPLHVDSCFFDQFSNLKCLTRLNLHAEEPGDQGTGVSGVRAAAVQLQTAILECDGSPRSGRTGGAATFVCSTGVWPRGPFTTPWKEFPHGQHVNWRIMMAPAAASERLLILRCACCTVSACLCFSMRRAVVHYRKGGGVVGRCPTSRHAGTSTF